MEWGLTRTTRSRPGWIMLEDAEAQALIRAMEQLHSAISLEERFGLILDAYRQYEIVLFELGLNEVLGLRERWPESRRGISLVAQPLSNFLTAQRHYADRAYASVGKISTSDEARALAKKRWTDFKAEFPIVSDIAELRDHSQHVAHLVHGMVKSMGVQRKCDCEHATQSKCSREGVESRIIPFLKADKLREYTDVNRGIQPDTLDRLAAMGDRVSITWLLRSYVDAIAEWHQQIREQISEDLQMAESIVRDAVERAQTAFDDNRTYVQVVRQDTNGDVVESFGVFTDPIDTIKLLHRQYPIPKNLSSRFISTDCESSE